MIILGLTGSIGMGKTTTALMFKEIGIPVYNADDAVHHLYQNEAVPILEKNFPDAIVNHSVDRKILSTIVMANPEKLELLESLIHPQVRKKQEEFLDESRNSNEKLVVLDIPLLFETGGEKNVDKIVVVTADPEIQRRRVLARKNMSIEKLNAIISRQTSDSIKRQKADFVIDTDKGLDHAREKVADIIKQLTQ